MSDSAAGWRTVRVFISSTFRDMQAERDHLVRFVFPRLREELLRRRIHLLDVDLRWGLTAEQDALEVCREIIDECRPRFICILGDRYGWTPAGEEHSITADEVHYAALDHLDRDEYRYFYFRAPSATASTPDDLASEYREPPGSDAEDKLTALKDRVRDAGLPVFDYTARWDTDRRRLVDLEAFGEAVYRDLLASVQDEFGTEPPAGLDWFAEENAAMEAFIEGRTERYVVGSRQTLLDEMALHADGAGEPGVLVVTGKPGSGKSALLGRLYRDCADSHPNQIVIPHFVGASQGSTSIRQTLRRLWHELIQPVREQLKAEEQERLDAAPDAEIRAAIQAEYEAPQDTAELIRAFPGLLARVTAYRPVTMVIDALDQLDATDNAHTLNWLPRQLPEGVRIICSSLECPALEALRRRTTQVREVICGPLELIDSVRIMRTVLERYHKRLSWQQRHSLLAKPDAGNPLYLLTALEELRTLGTYEEIGVRIEELPGTVTDLFDWILRRLAEGVEGQEAFGEDLVGQYTSCIATGRGGMTESELEALCATADDEGEFQVLHRILRPYLMHRGELVDYFHGQLREAVERRYLPDEAIRRARHSEIATLLRDRADPLHSNTWDSCPALAPDTRQQLIARALHELPYHLHGSASQQELADMLVNFAWLDSKLSATDVVSTISDFDFLPASHPARAVDRAIRQAAHMLRRVPGQLVEQVLARVGQSGDLSIQALLTSALATRREAWLRPVRASTRQSQAMMNTLTGHERRVWQVNPLGDGRAVSSSEDGTLRVWDLDKGECLHSLAVQDYGYFAFALAGEVRAVCASDDGALQVWDLDSGECLHTFPFQEHGSHTFALAGEGRVVFTSAEGVLEVRDVESGECLQTLRGSEHGVHHESVLTSDGHLALASQDDALRVWDLHTGECRHTLYGHEKPANWAVLASGDRAISRADDDTYRVWDLDAGQCLGCIAGVKRCVAGDARAVFVLPDATLEVWDIAGGECMHHLVGHRGIDLEHAIPYRLIDIALVDDRRVVSTSTDRTLRVWDLDTGECLHTLVGHEDRVHEVQIIDDRRIVSASYDETIRVWDLETGECRCVLHGRGASIESLAVTDDGRAISTSGVNDESIRVWDIGGEGDMRAPKEHEGPIRTVALTGDGRAVSASDDGTLRVWHLTTGECLHSLEAHAEGVGAITVTEDGRAVSGGRFSSASPYAAATGTQDASDPSADSYVFYRAFPYIAYVVHVWDLATGMELHALPGHASGINALAATGDGRAVSASGDNTLRVWDLETGRCLHTLAGHDDDVSDVAVTSDHRAVSASSDHTLRVWDLDTGECLRVLWGHESGVKKVAVSGDGLAVSGASDGTLCVWDLEAGECLAILDEQEFYVDNVALTGDGLVVSTSSDLGTRSGNEYLSVWDLETGECLHTASTRGEPINDVAAGSDGRYVISASGDGTVNSQDATVRVWDLATGAELAQFVAEGSVLCIAFDAQRKIVVAGDDTGAVHILELVEPQNSRPADSFGQHRAGDDTNHGEPSAPQGRAQGGRTRHLGASEEVQDVLPSRSLLTMLMDWVLCLPAEDPPIPHSSHGLQFTEDPSAHYADQHRADVVTDMACVAALVIVFSFFSYHLAGYTWCVGLAVLLLLAWLFFRRSEMAGSLLWAACAFLLLAPVSWALGSALNICYDRTALHQISLSGDVVVAPIALALTDDINATDRYGRTALHYAAAGDHANATQFLLDRGARGDIEDSEGLTPLELTRKRAQPQTVRLMLIRQAQTTAKHAPPDEGRDAAREEPSHAGEHELRQESSAH